MTESLALTLPSTLMVVDRSSQIIENDIMLPFAFDEVVCRKVGKGLLPPAIHIWRHRQAFVMGLRDRKLPHALEAMEQLEAKGFSVTVRNSGGAAVPLDPGVVNISLILPNLEQRMNFHDDFHTMYRFLAACLHRFSAIHKGEILGSYCPGDYDLSINGKKFCGIAQRRQTHAFVIQAFLNIEGDSVNRGDIVRQFYQRAAADDGHRSYPQVEPQVMASLSELIHFPSVACFVNSLHEFLDDQIANVIRWDDYPSAILPEMTQMAEELKIRYEKR